MKILITNPDAIFNSDTGKFYSGIEEIIESFNSIEGQQTIVISVEKHKLDNIPKSYEPLNIIGKARGGRLLIDVIKDHFKCDISEILVLGCKQMDVALAANSKILLLRADYAIEQNSGETIYSNGYGIPIKDSKTLKLFLDKFLSIKKPWFYKCDVTTKTVIYSLTNANTLYRDKDIVQIANKFREHLKNGDDSYKDEFLIYFLVSTYAIVNEFKDVNYWGIYPSSASSENIDLEFYKEKARQTYGIRTAQPIFVRHKKAPKRHFKSLDERIETGCDEELATIIINPYYRGKLKDKTVCIIDDFTNIGSSCETARCLLENAGVAKLIFITLGKFGKIYNQYKYEFTGDPFSNFNFKRLDSRLLKGEFNGASDLEFIKSLGEIVK